jgi:hypothetical protein
VDLAIVYPVDIDYEEKLRLYNFGKEVSKNNKVLVYEQQLGRGCANSCAQLSLLGDYIVPIVFVFKYLAIGFLGALGKNFYKVFKEVVNKKRNSNKLYIGSAMIQVDLDNVIFQYIFLNHHNEIEKKEAYDNIVVHLSSFDKALLTNNFVRFIWDRKNKRWEIF